MPRVSLAACVPVLVLLALAPPFAAAGGTVVKTVDESVSYVVLGDSLADGRPVECSASYQTAQRLGIKLLSEQEFFAML